MTEEQAGEGLSGYANLLSSTRDKSARRLPALVRSAFSLVRLAAPQTLRRITIVQSGIALLVIGRLLLAREVLIVVSDERGTSRLLLPVLSLLAVSVLQSMLGVLVGEQQRLLEARVTRHMQGRVLDVSQAVDLMAYEDPDFYDRLQRAQYGALFRPLQVTTGAVAMLAGALSAVALLLALTVIAPLLVPLVLLGFVPMWIVTKRNSRSAYNLEAAHTEADRRRAYFSDVLSDRGYAKEIRANGVASVLRARYDALYEERLARLRTLAVERTKRSLLAGLLAAVTAGLALTLVIHLVSTDRLSLPSAAIAAVGVLELSARLNALYSGAGSVYEGALYLEDAQRFFAEVPPTATPSAIPPAVPARGGPLTMTAAGVGFRYPGSDTPALQGITLHVPPGQVLAVVGQNGSGKTTLAMLLAGLLTPTEGSIGLGPADQEPLNPADLRDRVAVLFQDFARYELTLCENVALGHPLRGTDAAAVAAAAERAGLDRFARALPAGYDTLLGRSFFGGHELSVGQWQRVALARAFLRESDVLILDEPTAALDPQAEQETFEAVNRLAHGRTVIFISHRFSTVRSADRILVLDAGRLVEDGSHTELMDHGGLYHAMFEVQAAAYRTSG